jgi:hypothetical protein
MYIICSTIWYIPAPERKEYGKIGFFDLLRTSPHIQLDLETELDSEIWEGAAPFNPEVENCPTLVDIERKYTGRPTGDYPVEWARRIVKQKMERFRMTKTHHYDHEKRTVGILALHFADTINGGWLWRPHFGLPGDTAKKAKDKYDVLTHNGSEVCYYGRVVDQCGYRILQYWFFYPFNDWFSKLPGINKHEGDWECVFIYGRPEGEDGFTPTHTAYSAHHNSGEKIQRLWKEVETFESDGKHPLVYVGCGSHANYYSAGLHQYNLDKARGAGRIVRPNDWGAVRTLVDTGSITDEPDWFHFEGFWGAYIRDITTMQNAPSGPQESSEPVSSRLGRRAQWYAPRAWAGLPCKAGSKCQHTIRGWKEDPDPWWDGGEEAGSKPW